MFKKVFTFFAAIFAKNDSCPTHEQFIDAAIEGLHLQTSAHSSTWHFGEEQEWSADLEEGKLVLEFSNGVRATAPIQVIGTYNELDATFLWGWDHASVPESLREHANLARQWGKMNKFNDFMCRKVSCSEEDAWVFTAVANRLAKANGAYRGTSGTTLIFMTFGEVKLEKIKPDENYQLEQ